MTNEQAAELINIVREMKEHVAVIRDSVELKLTAEEKAKIEEKSRVRRGFAPRPNA